MIQTINPLLHDLALILVVAGVVTLIFRALKQPVVLGYILAGVLTGPYIKFIPTATDIVNVEFWGDIGVIFLLFGLGLEFSFKKLKSVGGTGAITTFSQAVMMLSMGFLIGKIFGWSTITSIFLGAMLSISSTSIIVKTFNDLGLSGVKSAQLVFGALIVEDILAILLLVMLPTLVISKTINGMELVRQVLYIAVFLLLWFMGGVFLIPTLYKRFRRFIPDETLIVVSIGLCFLMVVITLNAGISEALGAFVMGSILSGTIQKERIEKLITPLKDFFGAIFFVSVGMLVDPSVLLHYWPHVLIISLIILIAKPLSATIGMLFGGQPLRIALPAGLALCQIGEFSYIIARLGKDLSAIPDYLYPVIVTVSIFTTFASPYFIKMGEPFYEFIYSHLSPAWRNVIDKLGTGERTVNQESHWKRLIKFYVTRLVVNTLWMVTIGSLVAGFVNPIVMNLIVRIVPSAATAFWPKLLQFFIVAAAISPFIWALMRLKDHEGLFDSLWNDRKFYRGPLLFMVALRYLIVIYAISFLTSFYIASSIGAVIVILLTLVVVVILSNYLKNYYGRMADRFLTNLDSEGGRRFIIPRDMANELHMEKCVVGQNAYIAGKTIGQIHRAKNTGALIIQITRGTHVINLPSNSITLYPSDSLLILGSDAQIKSFMQLAIESRNQQEKIFGDTIEMKLVEITAEEGSPLLGHNANITSFREKFGVLVIGIEKGGSDAFLRPNSAITIEKGDTVWVVGNKEKVNSLKAITSLS